MEKGQSTMSSRAFVIGDIHGCLANLETLLTYWNPDSEKLFFLGDLINRGENSLGVVQLVMRLQKEYGAVTVGGNHESMFLQWLQAPSRHSSFFYLVGGKETLASFYSEELVDKLLPPKIAEKLTEDFPEEIAFMQGLPDYVEHGEYLFVHAGVKLDIEHWQDSGSEFFRSIREPFHEGENNTGKTIVFGHTPTRRIRPDKSNDIWISPCKTKFGIDGGAVYGGMLHGLHIRENNEYHLHSVDTKRNVTERAIQL